MVGPVSPTLWQLMVKAGIGRLLIIAGTPLPISYPQHRALGGGKTSPASLGETQQSVALMGSRNLYPKKRTNDNSWFHLWGC